MSAKIYTSKLGKKFSISPVQRPAEDDVVFFTPDEFSYLKELKCTPERFQFYYEMKKINFRHEIIPAKVKTNASHLADKFCAEICEGIIKAKKESA